MGSARQPFDVGESLDGFILFHILLAVHHLWDADNDSRRVEVVVESLALTQKLRREQQVKAFHPFTRVACIE